MERQFVFSSAPFPSCHAATLAQLPDGTLAAAWFGGTAERDPDVAIWMATKTASEDTWSEPIVVADVDGVPCWNPVLHARGGEDELLLFYKVGSHPQTWSGFLRRSHDSGARWSEPELLPAGILGPIKNKPIEVGDALLCGSSVESYRAWGCWIERTQDGGRTWTKHGPINVAGHLYGAIQPALVAGEDEVVMLCRTRGLERVVRGASTDGGRTWSPLTPVDLPHNNSGLDAARLADGRTVLAYNHTTTGRSPLNLAVSHDLGRSWTPGPVLEDEPGEFSYPAVVEGNDGRVHVVYTWNRRLIAHVTIAPDELPRGT